MKEGNLISEQQYISIIKEMIIRIPKRKLLFTGFPRTIEDMEIWDKEMKGSVNIKAALYFEVSSEEMKKRELERKEKRFIDNEKCILIKELIYLRQRQNKFYLYLKEEICLLELME